METGSTTDDGAVYVDGELVAREALPSGSGDNWDNFDLMTINNGGTYLFSGDTDGDITSDEFIAFDGSIVLREGETVGGIVLASSATIGGLSLNNRGEMAHLWSVSGGAEHLFFACSASRPGGDGSTLILSTGDDVDVDGDGLPDAVLTDFNTFGASFWLAEDGRIHVEVDLDYGAGDLEAVIALDLEPCFIFADGFESGDTSAWSLTLP